MDISKEIHTFWPFLGSLCELSERRRRERERERERERQRDAPSGAKVVENVTF